MEPEQNLFVSALGIDHTRSGVTVYAEAMEGEDTSLLSGFGDTIPAALNTLRASTPLKLDLSHCAIIALGKRKDDTEKMLLEYILSRPEDMLSVYIVACDNAKELLSCSPIGYELSSALKKNYYAGQMRTKATVMDILNNPEGFYLPYFSVSQNAYSFSGAAYYSGLTRVSLKSADEVRLINLLRGEFARGRITIDTTTFNISNTAIDKKVTDNAIEISLSLTLDGGDHKLLKDKLSNILNEFKNDYSLNVFGLKENGSRLSNDAFSKKEIELFLEVNKIAN